jgi:hypothetical protein
MKCIFLNLCIKDFLKKVQRKKIIKNKDINKKNNISKPSILIIFKV